MTLLVLLQLLIGEARYRDVAMTDLARFVYPRACVIGLVGRVRREADGDWHFRVSDGAAFVVAEIMPQIPIARPRRGQRIKACGLVRYDKAHRWYELHPLIRWEVHP